MAGFRVLSSGEGGREKNLQILPKVPQLLPQFLIASA